MFMFMRSSYLVFKDNPPSNAIDWPVIQVATKKNLTYYGIGCYRNRQKSFNPTAFCFGEKQLDANIWGCKKLGLPLLEWGGGWLEYGRFDDQGAWHFDKERIKFDLEVALKENAWCPILNRARVLQTLDKLPDVIDPKTNKNWMYRTNYEGFGDGFRQVAEGIRPVLNRASFYVIGDFKPEWRDETSPETKPTEIVLKVAVPSKISSSTKATTPPDGANDLGKAIFVTFVLLVLFRYLFGG